MDEIASTLAGIGSQVNTDENLPGTIMPGTIIITTTAGDVEYKQGGPNIGLHSVRVVYYGAVGIEPSAYAACRAVIKPIIKAIANRTNLGGAVQEIMKDPRAARLYEGPGTINYGDKPHTAVAFNYQVKENDDTSYNVAP